jgi:hypothetical protein
MSFQLLELRRCTKLEHLNDEEIEQHCCFVLSILTNDDKCEITDEDRQSLFLSSITSNNTFGYEDMATDELHVYIWEYRRNINNNKEEDVETNEEVIILRDIVYYPDNIEYASIYRNNVSYLEVYNSEMFFTISEDNEFPFALFEEVRRCSSYPDLTVPGMRKYIKSGAHRHSRNLLYILEKGIIDR